MKIGLIGVGAVGGMLALNLYKKYRNDFYIIAKGERAEKLNKNGICVNDEVFYANVTSSKKMDYLIVTVKNYSLQSALEDIRDVISDTTMILPLLNGIVATDRIQEAYPKNKVLYGIVLRTDAERTHNKISYSVPGEIQLGYEKNENPKEEIVEFKNVLETAGIKSVIYPDMKHMQWRKWMINIGANQISMLVEAPFKYFRQFEEIQIAVRKSIEEIQKIAEKAGVGLYKQDVEDIVNILVNYPPEKKSSMLQDFEAHRQTEIDYFAGTVIEMGKKYDVPTPINEILYYVIKAREKVYLEHKEMKRKEDNQ